MGSYPSFALSFFLSEDICTLIAPLKLSAVASHTCSISSSWLTGLPILISKYSKIPFSFLVSGTGSPFAYASRLIVSNFISPHLRHISFCTNLPLLDWEQDAPLIAADINKAAGCEVRALPYLHWWTFMAWFNSIGDGQLATLLRVRSKLRHGQKLQPWEQDYYRKNKAMVDLRPRLNPAEIAERQRLQRLLAN